MTKLSLIFFFLSFIVPDFTMASRYLGNDDIFLTTQVTSCSIYETSIRSQTGSIDNCKNALSDYVKKLNSTNGVIINSITECKKNPKNKAIFGYIKFIK